MSVKIWNNGKSEIYRSMPVECPNCEAQVQLTGYLEEGELRLEPCPQCEMPFILEVKVAGAEEVPASEQVKYQAKAMVTWFLDKGAIPQASAVIGPTGNVLSLLANVIHNGVMFFAPGKSEQLHATLAQFMIENFVGDDARSDIIRKMQETFDQRLAPDNTTPSDSEKRTPRVLNLDDILNPKPEAEPEEEKEDDAE